MDVRAEAERFRVIAARRRRVVLSLSSVELASIMLEMDDVVVRETR
jgi:hypothetical protein